MNQVRFETLGSSGRIILSAPPANAINRGFVDGLAAAVTQASLSEIRALMVLAEGPNFGTGGDISEFSGKSASWLTTFFKDANATYQAIESLRIPTVAVVRGACVSGHYELALHCDLIIAADDAKFTWIDAKAAVAPLAGGLQRLAQRVGRTRAVQHVMLAETLTATEALSLGIVSIVTPGVQLQAKADQIVELLAAGPTRAFGAMRALVKAWSNGGLSAADALMLDLTVDLFGTDDGKLAFQLLGDAAANKVAMPAIPYSGR